MEKGELIELVEDQLGEMRTNMARKHFHPEIIAYTFDKHYRLLLYQSFANDPYRIEGCLDWKYDLTLYKDEQTTNLFAILPVQTVRVYDVTGGVYGVRKSSDSTVKFEPYTRDFENRRWNRLGTNFYNSVRYWYERGADRGDLSTSVATSLDEYQEVVWFNAPATKLTSSDTVDVRLLPTFYSHGDSQEVHVPGNVGGINILIDNVIRDMLRKIGVVPQEDKEDDR
jgi:hypothetical protein